MKYLCDQMLGTLAKWLRLCGFDTFFTNSDIDDKELLDISRNENRILITRSKQIIDKGRKKNLKIIELTTTDLDKQLEIVLKKVKIDEKLILSRCSLCNTILVTIKKEEVIDKIPKISYENSEKFWFCSKCKKYYWMGSHFDNILMKIKYLTKKRE